MMAFTATFNHNASAGDNTADEKTAAQSFNPFAPNVTLSAAQAVKLAALEEGHGTGLLRRIRPADETGGGNRDGRRRGADGPDTAILEALIMTPQQWDAQIVTVGGVTMTNAEAQAARRQILENPERYISWAKEQGLIRDGEEQALIDTGRQITDLKELERNGQIKPEQKERMEALEGSRLGRVFEQVTAQKHLDKGRKVEARTDPMPQEGQGTAAPAQGDALFDLMTAQESQAPPQVPGSSSVDDPVFPNAPSLKSGFAAGLMAAEPLDRARLEPEQHDTPPRGPDRTAGASGLDL